jgi:hypothetical protein
MKEKDEVKLSRILFNMQGESKAIFPWGEVKIEIKYINYSSGGKGCPDSLLLLRIYMPVLGKVVSIQMPVLIEAEKAGMEAAMQDLEKFCERSMQGAMENGGSSFIEIPMLVATERPRHIEKEELKTLSATFKVYETKL